MTERPHSLDPIVPFEGGSSTLFDVVEVDVEIDSATVDSFFVPIPGEMAEWATTNGCGTEPAVTTVSDEVELREYPDCAGAEVDFYVFAGGHTWPGGTDPEIWGDTTQEISASELIWEFFFERER